MSNERPTPPRRVLVVDDCPDTTATLRMLLEVWGFQVRTACDGPAALALAAEFHPDTVLLDIGLPHMDGYEVARRLRQFPGLDDAFLVALTGFGQEQDHAHSRDAGFDHHLIKPCDPLFLRELLLHPSHAIA